MRADHPAWGHGQAGPSAGEIQEGAGQATRGGMSPQESQEGETGREPWRMRDRESRSLGGTGRGQMLGTC